MLTVAYLANRFPAAVEPYVVEEIEELRRRGIRVVSGSVASSGQCSTRADLVLRPARLLMLTRALWLCARRWKAIVPLVGRILFRGSEGPILRTKALVHTLWGGCYAIRLQEHAVDHIHVHHGFSASWIAVVAARLLNIEFSMTLHGSDLLVYQTYLDMKLQRCAFCVTVSEYNRRFILAEYPEIQSNKIVVARLGVEVPAWPGGDTAIANDKTKQFRILSVGRLHAVKDHAFLVRACAELKARGINCFCEIAGEGPERRRLESQIRRLGMQRCVHLFGHADRGQLEYLYARADLVVLTSRSEGIPLVLMEAMARGKLVLAPDITGIPELVFPERTGFLYQPGAMNDFLDQLIAVCSVVSSEARTDASEESPAVNVSAERLAWIRHAARVQVQLNFNRRKNQKSFCDLFLRRIASPVKEIPHESAVCQQVQLPI